MPDELAYLFNSFKIPDVKECTEGGKVKITEYPGMIARYFISSVSCLKTVYF